METKMLEIRDHGTMISALAIEISGDDGPLARCAGYGSPLVLLGDMHGGVFSYDPYEWGDRTWATSHHYIQENWKGLKSGDVVDVEFILKETSAPKASEAYLYGSMEDII